LKHETAETTDDKQMYSFAETSTALCMRELRCFHIT